MTSMNTISAARAEYVRLEAEYETLKAEPDLDAAIRAMSAAEDKMIRAPIRSTDDATAVAEHLATILEDAHESRAAVLARKLDRWLKRESSELLTPVLSRGRGRRGAEAARKAS